MKDPTSQDFAFDAQNLPYLQRLLENYRHDSSHVPDQWKSWFDHLNGANGIGLAEPQPKNTEPQLKTNDSKEPGPLSPNKDHKEKASPGQHGQFLADQMVSAYRTFGYRNAQLDPLGMHNLSESDLSWEHFGFTRADLSQTVYTDVGQNSGPRSIQAVYESLKQFYCGTIGYEFMHIEDAKVRQWILQRIEGPTEFNFSDEKRQRIVRLLREAVLFEEYIRKKYVGAKTFSLEGAETLIPLLDMAINQAADEGVSEIVVGMAHRGRLNVLANIVGQPMHELFAQFNDQHPELHRGGGDVKYHMGASGDRQTISGKQVHISLCFNPSHLEFVNPVALGRLRAKQDRTGDKDRRKGMGILIHGDAGFAGEGIVQETLNLSELPAYQTGGTLHIVVNNQLGFTTPPSQGRSPHMATAVARMLKVPILHVNGEYPESVARVVQLAMEFRHQFQRDVIINMLCFRRFGHNEADEPGFTQPLVYQAIEHHSSISEEYLERSTRKETQADQKKESSENAFRDKLKKEYHTAQDFEETTSLQPRGVWEEYSGGPEPEHDPEGEKTLKTGVKKETLKRLLTKLTEIPSDFHVHRKLQGSIEQRREMAAEERPLDWSAAEALAFATLATEGHDVRLTGQDSERGTFSQRHAVLHDIVNGTRHEIFRHLSEDQAAIEIHNSPLSEAGVLGFEYGFSLDFPSALVAWEAQFGDFCNAAQVIIDQFISSAEDKWNRLTGLVMLLPHGFEGQGPEHSSARLERFLMLAAEDNIQVAMPTTPAQYFHLLRRQVKRRWRKPLVIMTPKSLLRSSQAASSLDEFVSGNFQRVISDERDNPSETNRILLCSGKVYYDLIQYREDQACDDIAIIRVEQLYPLQNQLLLEATSQFDSALSVTWVQEEPENMGAWPYWRCRFGDTFPGDRRLNLVARPPSASPATGSKSAHKLEQKELIEQAFSDCTT